MNDHKARNEDEELEGKYPSIRSLLRSKYAVNS